MSYPPPPSGDQQPPPDGPGWQQGGYPPPGDQGSYPSPPPPGYQGGYPPPPPGYTTPGYGGGSAGPNRKALWSMVIGIVSVPLGCYACLGWIGIAAIVLGNQAKREILASGGLQSGEGQAKAGVITGWIGAVLGTIVLIANILLIATGNELQYNLNTDS